MVVPRSASRCQGPITSDPCSAMEGRGHWGMKLGCNRGEITVHGGRSSWRLGQQLHELKPTIAEVIET